MPVKTVLSIDGGGICGVFSHQILNKIARVPTFHADLIVGVSAGAIVGALLASGLLETVDDETIRRCTTQSLSGTSVKGPWFGPKYTGVTKSDVLHSIFGDIRFGDLHVPMAILVDRIENTPELCRSWDPEYRDIPLVQILDATSAVPVLFPPVTINGQQYIDGGTVSSSPICIAHLAALELFDQDKLSVISIGTADRYSTANPKQSGIRFENNDMGIIQLISLGLPLKVMTQGSTLVNEMSKKLLCPRFIRIEGNLVARLDDASMFDACVVEAKIVWDRMEHSIAGFISRNIETDGR